MQKPILESHVKWQEHGYLITVAVNTQSGSYQALSIRSADYSMYMMQQAIERGRLLKEEEAKSIFPDLANQFSYDSVKPYAKPDDLTSLSDLYEKAKDQIRNLSPNPSSQETTDLLQTLSSIRDLAAPAIVKTFATAD